MNACDIALLGRLIGDEREECHHALLVHRLNDRVCLICEAVDALAELADGGRSVAYGLGHCPHCGASLEQPDAHYNRKCISCGYTVMAARETIRVVE